MPKVTGKSWPVRTRCTPGCALAFSMSTDSMSACGWGLRRSFMCSMRGSTMSSAKRVCPVTLARPSTRRRGLPRTFIAHSLRGVFDRFEDLLVSGAAAKIPRNRLLDALARRLRLLLEQCFRRHEDSGRAVAALRGAQVGEGGLQWMELRAVGEAFDGIDPPALTVERKHQAGKLRFAVHEQDRKSVV